MRNRTQKSRKVPGFHKLKNRAFLSFPDGPNLPSKSYIKRRFKNTNEKQKFPHDFVNEPQELFQGFPI
jgi:hypothetical protein